MVWEHDGKHDAVSVPEWLTRKHDSNSGGLGLPLKKPASSSERVAGQRSATRQTLDSYRKTGSGLEMTDDCRTASYRDLHPKEFPSF